MHGWLETEYSHWMPLDWGEEWLIGVLRPLDLSYTTIRYNDGRGIAISMPVATLPYAHTPARYPEATVAYSLCIRVIAGFSWLPGLNHVSDITPLPMTAHRC